jgi:hypothetical protein
MATSGTASFNLDILEIIDEAYERCGAEGARTGYELRTARRSLNLLLADLANQGINLWTIEQGSIPLVEGVEGYDLPVDTVDLLEAVIRTNSFSPNQLDIPVSRISVSTYATLPNKNAKGRPLQVWINRQITPRLNVWPTPNNDTYELVYWRLRRVQDASDGTETVDVPFRFLPSIIAGLAYYLALKTPGALERLGLLKSQYDEALLMATTEDREKAPLRLVPRVVR